MNLTRRKFLRHAFRATASGLLVPAVLAAGPVVTRRVVLAGAPAPPAPPAGYTVYASAFDGTNDYMARGAALTGCVDGRKGIVSVWCKIIGGNGVLQRLFFNLNSYCHVWKGSDNKFNVTMQGQFGVTIASIESASTYLAGTGWLHLFSTWDASAGLRKLYINGVSDLGTDSGNNADIYYNQDNWFFGADSSGADKINMEVCEVYLNTVEYLDDPTKFASGGKPISLDADGSLPTGTAPIIYLKNPYDTFGTNSGTGGNFTVTGALTQGTPP